MKQSTAFGYEMRDGKIVPHKIESEIIKYTFEKQNEYCENPPEDLVRAIIEEYENDGERIAYEEAKKKVPYAWILQRIVDEINEEWKEYFAENIERKRHYYVPVGESKGQVRRYGEIINREEWVQVQTRLKDKEMTRDETPVGEQTMK